MHKLDVNTRRIIAYLFNQLDFELAQLRSRFHPFSLTRLCAPTVYRVSPQTRGEL